MKGLTHFISGIAAVSFIPQVVQRSATNRAAFEGAESSFLLAMAGLFAIMPDTLDFKLGRFFEKAEVEISPDPNEPDAQEIANTLGEAIDKAWQENREVRVQLNTMRLSADRWRRYELQFDTKKQEIIILIHEIVTTSQVPFPGTAPENSVGIYSLKHAKLLPGSTRNTKIDIMSGPMYGFKPMKDDDFLTVEFLPWHRTWSHSYTLGAFLSGLVWILALLMGWKDPWLYPIVAFLGFATHITEDLTGHMGGSLIWPFIKERTRGLCLFHAANSDANFVTDFIAFNIIIFNLDRFTTQMIPLPWFLYYLIFLIGPLLIYFLPRFIWKEASEKPLFKPSSEMVRAHREKAAMEEMEAEADSISG